jgi:hypothetical protein
MASDRTEQNLKNIHDASMALIERTGVNCTMPIC